ncbi:MAG TPA: hypothetical protein VGK51_04850 [Actinomycetota bacterium]|jgi:hypothetical protein
MLDFGRSFEACGLGVPLLSLEVGHARVVLSFDQGEHRLWMVDVQGASTGAVPVHGDYQETLVSNHRVLGGPAPPSATRASLRYEDGKVQAGLVDNGVWLVTAPLTGGHVTFWDDAGMPVRVLPFPASSARPVSTRGRLPDFLSRRVVGRGTVTYGTPAG